MRNNVWRVLANDPTSRGFGFVVLEGQATLVDWGVKGARSDKKSETLKKVSDLIGHYHPRMLIVEDCHVTGSRRCARVKHLLDDIRNLAAKEGLKCRRISPLAVKKVFLVFHAATKHEIARAIGTQLPELATQSEAEKVFLAEAEAGKNFLVAQWENGDRVELRVDPERRNRADRNLAPPDDDHKS